MKVKKLMALIVFGLTAMSDIADASETVSLNSEGLGQVLLYPYYTVRDGNDTFISVVNTTDRAKSVRVRFLEGLNSREVLSFNLYLAAFDVWVAALTTTDIGDGVELLIPDSSCTVPYYFGDDVLDPDENEFDRLGRVEFTDTFFTGELDDPGPDDKERVQSGHIELIEMGTMVFGEQGSEDAATHILKPFDDAVQLARPADCQQLVEAWSNPADRSGYWLQDSSLDHEPPSGGLRGSATIIDVFAGTMFSYDAVAIDGFSTEVMHFAPTDSHPHLNSGNVTTSNVSINGAIDHRTWPTGVEAVSASIMYDTIMNEYVVDPIIAGLSEWVLTLPTKRFYTDSLTAIDPIPVPPFSTIFNGAEECDTAEILVWDRETTVFISIPPIGPPVRPDLPEISLCYGVNIVRFSTFSAIGSTPASTEIMGETRFSTVQSNYTSGWARIGFGGFFDQVRVTRSTVDAAGIDTGVAYSGLPAIGFWVNTFSNGTLLNGTILSNYGGTLRHSGSRQVGGLSETP